HLRYSLGALPLLGARPVPQERALRHPLSKPVRRCEREQRLRTLVDGVWLPAELMEPSSMMQCETQAKGSGQLVRQRQRLLAALQGLPRIAQYPQDLGRMAPGRNADVTPEGQRLGAVRLGTVEGLRLRKVLSGRCQLTEKIQGAPEAGVGVYKTLRV